MQINHYPLINNKYAFTLFKLVILLLCLFFIGNKLLEVGFDFPEVSLRELIFVTLLVLVLMPLNWYLEALRWKISISFEEISIGESIGIVLRGLTLNWIIPFTAGDIGSRLIGMKNYKKAIFAMTLNRISIFLITIIFGSFSVAFYFKIEAFYIVFGLLASASLFLLVRRESSDQSYFLSSKIIIEVSGLTILRYVVFSLQYFLLLSFFNPDLTTIIIILGIGWVFLFRSIIPSLFGNLGIREASSIVFFQELVPDLNLIIFPSLIIWVINTIIPSCIGLIPMLDFGAKLTK